MCVLHLECSKSMAVAFVYRKHGIVGSFWLHKGAGRQRARV